MSGSVTIASIVKLTHFDAKLIFSEKIYHIIIKHPLCIDNQMQIVDPEN